MVAQLLWIAGVYAFAVILVHVLHVREKFRKGRKSGERVHYIVITRNHEPVIEWYLRALMFQAFLTGKRLRVQVVDDSSSDGTLEIVSRMVRSSSSLELAGTASALGRDKGPERQEMVLDLRMSGLTVKWPVFQASGSRGSRSERGDM